MVKGETGQSEKAYFCKPLKYKLGKQEGIHRFLDMPSTPKALLGRDLLEQLEIKIIFKNGEVILEVKDQQYVEMLSLILKLMKQLIRPVLKMKKRLTRK